jgi:heme a synthase
MAHEPPKEIISVWHRNLLLAASLMTCLLIALGGVVCVTQSGKACPDWPGCFGRIIPPPQVNSIIEYSHRLVAGLTGLIIIAAAVVSWRRARSIRWISRPPAIAILFLLAVIVFGALAVLRGLPPWMAALDLGSALVVLALMLTATVVAFARRANPTLPDRLSYRGNYAWLTLWTLAAVFITLDSAVLVAGPGSLTRCLGWPLYSQTLIAIDPSTWLHEARFIIGWVAAILMAIVATQAWRAPRQPVHIRRAAAWAGGMFLLQLVAGGLVLLTGFNTILLLFYTTSAAAFWSLLVVLVVLTGLPANKFEG